MRLSKNFTLKEFTNSQTAIRRNIPNIPNEEEIGNIKRLVLNVLQPLRAQFGAVIVSSGYRSKELNMMIGGVSTSQHIKGEAADFHIVAQDLKETFNFIVEHLEFDQLIYEFDSWVHVSYSDNNRNEKLKAEKVKGLTVYKKVGKFIV